MSLKDQEGSKWLLGVFNKAKLAFLSAFSHYNMPCEQPQQIQSYSLSERPPSGTPYLYKENLDKYKGKFWLINTDF